MTVCNSSWLLPGGKEQCRAGTGATEQRVQLKEQSHLL